MAGISPESLADIGGIHNLGDESTVLISDWYVNANDMTGTCGFNFGCKVSVC